MGILQDEVLEILQEKLAEALEDKEEGVRYAAVIALAKIKDARTMPALIPTLGDKAFLVRRGTVAALGEIGDKRARGILEEIAKSDPNNSVRKVVQEALIRIREK